MQLPDRFDARSVAPNQGGVAHPPGMFPFQITNTYLQDTKDKTGAMLCIEMTSPVGMIINRYNVVNPEPKAMEIANGQLSALCHAINIFDVGFPKKPDGSPIYEMAGHTLRGGQGRMEIVPQKDKDGKDTGYMRVQKVLDINGNEPGKAPAGAPQTQPQQGNWGGQQPQQNAAPLQQQPQGQPQWGNPQQQQPTQQPAQNAGWSQGPNTNAGQTAVPGPAWANK